MYYVKKNKVTKRYNGSRQLLLLPPTRCFTSHLALAIESFPLPHTNLPLKPGVCTLPSDTLQLDPGEKLHLKQVNHN